MQSSQIVFKEKNSVNCTCKRCLVTALFNNIQTVEFKTQVAKFALLFCHSCHRPLRQQCNIQRGQKVMLLVRGWQISWFVTSWLINLVAYLLAFRRLSALNSFRLAKKMLNIFICYSTFFSKSNIISF